MEEHTHDQLERKKSVCACEIVCVYVHMCCYLLLPQGEIPNQVNQLVARGDTAGTTGRVPGLVPDMSLYY